LDIQIWQDTGKFYSTFLCCSLLGEIRKELLVMSVIITSGTYNYEEHISVV